uniref:Uncharacterized protein n=1 Tax=Ditylenchus dipsaci TaxID=166011 RepID=A0A915EMT0_9BILA
MAHNVDSRWLANVIAQVENQNRNQPTLQRREVISEVKKAAITELGSSSTDIVSAAKSKLTDYELLALPTDRGLQDRAQRKKKPIGLTASTNHGSLASNQREENQVQGRRCPHFIIVEAYEERSTDEYLKGIANNL